MFFITSKVRAFAACVALGDHLTGADVSFTLLYLGPIGFATWFVGAEAGVVLSVASAFASTVADLSTRVGALPPGVTAWNLAVQLGVFLAHVGLFAALKALKDTGLTVLLVEQNVHLAFAVSDYAYVIAEGRLFSEGLPATLAAMPEIRRAYLGL